MTGKRASAEPISARSSFYYVEASGERIVHRLRLDASSRPDACLGSGSRSSSAAARPAAPEIRPHESTGSFSEFVKKTRSKRANASRTLLSRRQTTRFSLLLQQDLECSRGLDFLVSSSRVRDPDKRQLHPIEGCCFLRAASCRAAPGRVSNRFCERAFLFHSHFLHGGDRKCRPTPRPRD